MKTMAYKQVRLVISHLSENKSKELWLEIIVSIDMEGGDKLEVYHIILTE